MENPVPIDYIGPSMNPTLKAGDVLKVVPYGSGKIRVGDIVVFRAAGDRRQVVHRVVALDSQGVKTRGDNNLYADCGVLSADEIIGRVVSVERALKELSVCGGRWGKVKAEFLYTANRANRLISKALHPVYRRLARAGLFRQLLSPWVAPTILYFKRSAGTEMQLVIGRRVIGKRLAGQTQWRIRRPFRLLVDETLLTK